MIILFWSVLALVVYTYIGFPLTLWLLSNIRGKIPLNEEAFYPTVTLVVSAYNEEVGIEEKLKNCISLEYPREKIQIIILSDGSTDNTNQIVKDHEGQNLKLVIFSEHRGKHQTIKDSLSMMGGEILIFTDADVTLKKDALVNIVKPFREKHVGAVGGNLEYRAVSSSFRYRNYYWMAEQYVRLRESDLGAMCFIPGPFWALRKELFPLDVPLHAAIDAVIPMRVISAGYAVVMAENARAATLSCSSVPSDARTLVRTVNRGFQAILHNAQLLNVFRYPIISFCLIWHKLMRWLTIFLLFILLLSSLKLSGISFYRYLFIGQIIFYLLALTGAVSAKARRIPVIQLPYYICSNLLASFVGLWQSIFNKRISRWQTNRR